MKAITILQPWASLIACGAKRIETRSWATQYRGRIAIHAAKDQDKKGERIRHIVARAEQYGIIIPEMHFGAIIAIATLTHCLKINESQIYYLEKDKSKELAFGDFTPGRYAWILDNIQAIKPVPAKGMQRIWNWVGDLDNGC
jgi:hypothetical protein